MKTSINMMKAIDQLGGSTQLYVHVLTRFKEKYSQIDKKIEHLVLAGELAEARRLTHSIKGLSGNVGSTQLQNASKQLEQCYVNEKKQNDDVFKKFSCELQQVLKEIDVLILELSTAEKEIAVGKEDE